MNYRPLRLTLQLALLALLASCASYAPPPVHIAQTCPKLPPLDKALDPTGYPSFLAPLTIPSTPR